MFVDACRLHSGAEKVERWCRECRMKKRNALLAVAAFSRISELLIPNRLSVIGTLLRSALKKQVHGGIA